MGTANAKQLSMRGQLAKQEKFNGVQLNNITNAIAAGGNMASLLGTLTRLEQEREHICSQLALIETEIEQATIARPTAAIVQEAWSEIGSLWGELDEAERTELLSSVVNSAKVNEKDRVLLELSPIPKEHGHWFATKSQMGAGR